MIKTLETIDIKPILASYMNLETSMQWTDYGTKSSQVGLQYKDGEDPCTSAVGKSQGKEIEYTNINPVFKDSIFEEIINKYNFKRTRLMWVGPWSCYSMHRDETPRIHIPLITNPECYFVFMDGMVKHMKTGAVYWIDTTQRHTFMNCSAHRRLHLVGVVES
jgi:hypothetical protein